MSAYADAALAARRAVHAGSMPDREELRELFRAALKLAPRDERQIWKAYLRGTEPGHQIRVKSYPMRAVIVDGASTELIADVESAFPKETP